tara:strand:- start:314 stop:832 length:519 start_codon:yes stop_codon:yes gene_type:complete
LPYTEDGKFYTTRLGDDDSERIEERIINAKKWAAYGGRVGSAVPLGGTAVGTALGAIGGFILGDSTTIFPIDMIAIPAYQAYLLTGDPAFQIYIKEGEVLTQVMPTDAMVAEVVLESPPATVKRTRAPGAGLPKKYAKMGFKKGWAAYKKTPAYKKKLAAKKKKTTKRRSKK